jgi:hypothetical protein
MCETATRQTLTLGNRRLHTVASSRLSRAFTRQAYVTGACRIFPLTEASVISPVYVRMGIRRIDDLEVQVMTRVRS